MTIEIAITLGQWICMSCSCFRTSKSRYEIKNCANIRFTVADLSLRFISLLLVYYQFTRASKLDLTLITEAVREVCVATSRIRSPGFDPRARDYLAKGTEISEPSYRLGTSVIRR